MKRVAAIAALAFVVLVAGGAAADTFQVRLVSQTNSTITLGWDPQPGYGYLFSSDGVLRSRTNDPSRTSVKFSKVPSGQYDVDVIVKGANGHYPAAPPPGDTTPPSVSLTSPTNGSTVSGTINVSANASDNVGVTKIEFFRDGAVFATDTTAPYSVPFNTTAVANGSHTFAPRAYDAAGNATSGVAVAVTVSNTAPPAAQCADGIDNDGDSKVDLADPGCSSSSDNDETDPVTPPPTGYPDASNTGVPAGTTLTAYTGPSNVTVANTVITGKTIGCIEINAPGVIIRNSRISCGGFYAVLVADSGPGTLLIEDSEVDCKDTRGTGIGEAEVVARRLDISKCENGFDINQNVTVEDSYIHDLFQNLEAHPDGIQFATGRWNGSTYVCCTQNVTIRHNTIYGTSEVDGEQGNAAIIDHAGGPTVNILIDNNLLAGGGYTLYCAIDATGVNYRVINNHFSTRFSSKVGFYGPSADCADETQSGNVIHETGQPITLG